MIRRLMRKLHRSLGGFVFLFLIVFSVSGLLLNHTEQLQLDKCFIKSSWLLKHYQIDYAEADHVFTARDIVISQFGELIFIDTEPVATLYQPLRGVVSIDEMLLLATEQGITLLTLSGELIESMGAELGIPETIQSIGLSQGQVIVKTAKGVWQSNSALQDWQIIISNDIKWSAEAVMPQAIQLKLADYFQGKGISLEKIILDIHNGHIIKNLGVWLSDIAAILIIFLSITGLVLWFKR